MKSVTLAIVMTTFGLIPASAVPVYFTFDGQVTEITTSALGQTLAEIPGVYELGQAVHLEYRVDLDQPGYRIVNGVVTPSSPFSGEFFAEYLSGNTAFQLSDPLTSSSRHIGEHLDLQWELKTASGTPTSEEYLWIFAYLDRGVARLPALGSSLRGMHGLQIGSEFYDVGFSLTVSSISDTPAVPEPTGMALMSLGFMALAAGAARLRPGKKQG